MGAAFLCAEAGISAVVLEASDDRCCESIRAAQWRSYVTAGNFDDGRHWVSMYRARFQGDIPPLQMRICTKFKPENGDVPSDVPSYSTFPLKFLAKLLADRIAMLLHR
jgi:hypothetical protein